VALKAYGGQNPSGVYELQLDIFCLETLLGILPPRPWQGEIALPPGAARVNALIERKCGGKATEVVSRGQDPRVYYHQEAIWKWREKKALLSSVMTVTLIPGVLLITIVFTTMWFFRRASEFRSGTAKLLSVVEPLLVQVIVLLLCLPACFGFFVDHDDRALAIFLVVFLATVWFVEFRTLARTVRNQNKSLRPSAAG
jgi:hypothetical protein